MAYLLKEIPHDDDIRSLTSKFSDLGSPYFESLVRLLKIGSELDDKIQTFFESHGLSDGRFSILFLLYRTADQSPLISQSDLAKKMKITRPSVTSFIDSLERDGFLERTPDDSDRRIHLLRLTPKGFQKVEEVLPTYMHNLGQFMSCLDLKDVQDLYGSLDKLLKNVDTISMNTPPPPKTKRTPK